MQIKKVLATVAAASMAIGLAACSPSASSSAAAEGTDAHKNDSASCQNTIKKEGVEKVTVWAWYPAIEQIVDQFNETHDDVQVCWNNAGQGGPEYTKFQNAIKAGKGGPDIIQLEYEAMPQFVAGAQKHLVDLTKYDFAKYKSEYTEGAWNGVTIGGGDSVYGVPVDLGPFVMYVNQAVFDKYNVAVPTTWEEFAQAGRDLKAAGYDGYLSDWAPNGTAVNVALFAQKGAKVYNYSAETPDKVGIDFNSQEVKDVMDYWRGLVEEGLVDTTDSNTTDWNTNMLSGKYAAYVQASWLGGYLKGLDGSEQGTFRIAKAPVWDSSTPSVNQGGSAWAVTDQAANTKVAVQVAHDLFDSDEAQQIGVTTAGLFPAWTKMLESDYFKNLQDPFFGDQKINEVTIPTAQAYKGDDFLPFQTYAYDTQSKSFASIVRDGQDTSSTLSALTNSLNEYAKQQGFTVTE
ncbi:ABC transporter substrate-binding protein [Alloscardovia criceti]|uniref:ABC transporter substrate-binding protein n=1 Tax=Alloscardovia criceti TaxID=356828 RepID=UPI000375D251|nr:extracellular solute-binding protein [Alloscardovia criceti]